MSSDSEDNDSSESEDSKDEEKKENVFDKFRKNEILDAKDIPQETYDKIMYRDKDMRPEEEDLDDEEW